MKPLNLFWSGFRAILPLWIAAAPFALSYAVAGKSAGLSVVDLQVMSLTIDSAATQIVIVQLLGSGAQLPILIATAILMNLYTVIYGLVITPRLTLSRLQRALLSFFLTDGAFAVALAAPQGMNVPFMLGAGVSMFVAWNLFTVLGLLIGASISIPATLHLDFIVPLTFVILLVSMLKSSADRLVAALAVALALVCIVAQLGSLAILVVSVGAAAIGAWALGLRAPETVHS